MKTVLLIIDPQNDFCENTGTLYVPGAVGDITRLVNFINKNADKIDYIHFTTDDHQPNDISHANFWIDKDGNHPNPFTIIKADDVKNGVWKPVNYDVDKAYNYINQLEIKGKYAHIIWPTHCIAGSHGADICEPLMNAVLDWTKNGKYYGITRKGTYPYSEHFGAFMAEIPDANIPETQFNQQLADMLNSFDKVYIAGEAKSHCVANTISQLFDTMPQLVKKLVILEDAMSPVAGFEHTADAVYQKAVELGAKIETCC
ncbi:MAG: isochorismatase family protein [Bacteroidales bacterium]|nr:isochorismatase family protein [Bacteroidales bacterium]